MGEVKGSPEATNPQASAPRQGTFAERWGRRIRGTARGSVQRCSLQSCLSQGKTGSDQTIQRGGNRSVNHGTITGES